MIFLNGFDMDAASFALREDGFETIMVNSNPETVSTDYDTSANEACTQQ